MIRPNTTFTTTMTLTDASNNLISTVSAISVLVTFPDETTSTLTPTNQGNGVYAIEYSSKGTGVIREDWTVQTVDSSMTTARNFIPVSY